jgi:hypothetical protein
VSDETYINELSFLVKFIRMFPGFNSINLENCSHNHKAIFGSFAEELNTNTSLEHFLINGQIPKHKHQQYN